MYEASIEAIDALPFVQKPDQWELEHRKFDKRWCEMFSAPRRAYEEELARLKLCKELNEKHLKEELSEYYKKQIINKLEQIEEAKSKYEMLVTMLKEEIKEARQYKSKVDNYE